MTEQQRLTKAERATPGTTTRDISQMAGQFPAVNPGNQTPESMQAWANAFFGPGVPRAPLQDKEEIPRTFDYMSGINLQIIPRSGFGLIPFYQLRAFADTFEYVRITIEAFKREIRSLEWDIVPANTKDDKDYSAEIEELRAFWRFPDRVNEFDAWLNSVLEDMLVIDAVSLYIENENGKINAVTQIDGATIRPLLDVRGRVPPPPTPGYSQVIKGVDWLWMNADSLIYRPFNTAVNSCYGTSPTEFIMTTVTTTLRRQMAAMVYWDQTNTPEALVGLPSKWSVEDIKTYQEYFDALLTGDYAKLRRIKFFPVDGANVPVHEFRRPDTGAGATAQDEWALKVCCWAFGLSPSEFGLVNGSGLGGKGFMEGAENALYRFGIGPVIQYLQNIITGIISRQTKSPLCFRFVNIGPSEDQVKESGLMESQLRNGAIDINVWRQRLGQEPIENAKPFIIIGNTPILLDELFNPKPPPAIAPPPPLQAQPTINAEETQVDEEPADDQAFKLAISAWREKVVKRMKDGKPAECDPPTLAKAHIPGTMAARIKAALGSGSIDAAFELVKKKPTLHANATRDKIEAGFAKALAKAFDDIIIPNIKSEYDAVAMFKPDVIFWASFRSEVEPVLLEWITKSAQQGVDEVQNDEMFQVKKMAKASAVIDWDLVNDKAVGWATAHTDTLLGELTANTQSGLGDALARWIESGDPLPDLIATFKQLINDPVRAELIASTETTRAFAEGNTQAWRAQGVEGRRWFTAEDELVCPACGELTGSVAALGDDFDGGIDNPPAHPRCRCYLQPVEVVE